MTNQMELKSIIEDEYNHAKGAVKHFAKKNNLSYAWVDTAHALHIRTPKDCESFILTREERQEINGIEIRVKNGVYFLKKKRNFIASFFESTTLFNVTENWGKVFCEGVIYE